MYYKSVNRGIAFTKPGVYVFGLVLLIGMIAVTTGINGLYVFLSAGLGGFIISGLLSEKAMKNCSVRSLAAARCDAGGPFTAGFTVQNASPWFTVFALDVVFMLEPPRFRFVSRQLPGIAAQRLARVAPGGTHAFEVYGSGLPRGLHRQVYAVHQTTFPFGILEKFKQTQVPASLIVAPATDMSLLDQARALLRKALASLDTEKEFFCHRAYTPQGGLKDLDWRKSANRPPQDWVVKQYRAPAGVAAVRLAAPWSLALPLADAASYELYLVRIRTALRALEETGRAYYVDWGDGVCSEGYEVCLAALAGAPPFAARAAGLGDVGNGRPARRPATLRVTLAALTWEPAGGAGAGAAATPGRG